MGDKDFYELCDKANADECFRQLEKLNHKLLEAERSKDRFLSLVRNEFDNPLVSMVTLLKILDKKLKEKNPEEYESLHLVYMDALKLNYQLSNILAVAEVETGVLEKNVTLFSINAMLNDIDDSLAHIFENKNISVKKTVSCVDEIYNDRDKIYSILINLIGNAYEYSTPGSEVSIEIFEDDKKLFFTIKNRGEEIKDAHMIFDAFYQQEQSYNRRYQGLGVGLSVVGAYVDFLRGEIFVTRDGDYNVFVAQIPVFEHEGEQSFGDGLDAFMFD